MDYEFEVLHKDFQYEGLTLNNTAADEHVPQIEIQITQLHAVPPRNPLAALDQHEISKIPIGSSSSVPDAVSNGLPLLLSTSRQALLTACMRMPMLTTRIMLLIF